MEFVFIDMFWDYISYPLYDIYIYIFKQNVLNVCVCVIYILQVVFKANERALNSVLSTQ